MSLPPAKKHKKSSGHHLKEWEEKFAGIIKLSPKGVESTYCVPCCKSIEVAASGVYDVKAHFDTAEHEERVEKTKTFRPIDCRFKIKKPEGSAQESEVLFCQFVAIDRPILPVTRSV